jgi:hypothetical protein
LSIGEKKLPQIHWLVVTYPSEKYEFVNWEDGIPNLMGKIIHMFQTTNQNKTY